MGFKSTLFLSALKLGKAQRTHKLKKKNSITATGARNDVKLFNNLIGFLQIMRQDVVIHEELLNQIKCWHIKPLNESKTVILYLHGGGYIFSLQHLSNFFRYFLPELSKACEAEVWAPDYRTAPEDPYPASIDDCYQTYLALLASGTDPRNIFVMGDSAGGGLTLALLQKMRDEGKPLPKAAITLSPLTDLAGTGESMVTREDRDPLFSRQDISLIAKLIASQDHVKDPYLSPLYGNYEGLPPLMILVGGREILFDDSTRVADKAKKAGVDVTLDINEDMIHTYPVFGGIIKEGKEALGRIAAFVRKHSR